MSFRVSGTEEEGYFEWFKCRTALKLPGSFISSFWNTLLFQASLNEPAVLHAVLALSSVQKRGTVNTDGQRTLGTIPDEQEKFTLQHYVKAISHLQPHFLIKDRASARVALITCVVFVCLEFLRGHFETGQMHLRNGLKVLEELQILTNEKDRVLRSKPGLESTDDWILEAFSRLYLQMELFEHTYQQPCLLLQIAEPETPVLVVSSMNEAWRQLQWLLRQVFHLTHQARPQAAPERECLRRPLALLGIQQHIRLDLARWLDMYEAFKKRPHCHRSVVEEQSYQLLHAYHTMAGIMADTCLQQSNEMIFDCHTNQFVLLLEHLINLWTISSTTSPAQALPRHLMDMPRSIVDMGWVSPLYYVATKCRVHRIRLQAIRLIESTSHREGMWDSKTAACVMRKVMELEERDFYKDFDTADSFSLLSLPCSQGLLSPSLPESHRISGVEVVLSGAPMDTILLFRRQKQKRTDNRVLVTTYNLHLQRWTDASYE